MESDSISSDSAGELDNDFSESADEDGNEFIEVMDKKIEGNNANGVESSKRQRRAPKPRTLRRGHSRQPRGRKKFPKELVIIDSNSSDSDFVAPLYSSEEDDDDSCSDYKKKNKARKPKIRGGSKRFASRGKYDSDDDIPSTQVRGGSANSVRGARAPRQAGRQRSRQPAKVELRWEKLHREWDEEWACKRDWGEDPAEAVHTEDGAVLLEKRPLEQREPPPELITPLLPFQKEWLAWSLKQEACEIKGGILADEMGMGKTIQAIALIVAGRSLNRIPRKLDLNTTGYGPQASGGLCNPLPQLPRVKATLVICPLVAVMQWKKEVARFTREGSVKVLVYHGPKRGQVKDDLSKYDIVLTTYSVVEVEYRKNVMPPKDKCKWCRRQFYPDKMAIHQRYFCGPHAQKTDKQAKQVKRKTELGKNLQEGEFSDSSYSSQDVKLKSKGKGVVDDSSDSSQDFKGKTRGKGRGQSSQGNRKLQGTSAGRGRGRKRKVSEIDLGSALEKAIDHTQAAETKPGSSNGNSLLHAVRWERVVLDEAHNIKDRRCSTSKAVFALQSEYKWALSGTPLQNRVGELYSLVRFLGMDPYSYYFCRKCDCSSLEYKFAAQGQKCDCGHTQMVHFCWWNKYIAAPIKKDGYGYQGCRSMMLLKQKVLSSCLLRRTKLERAADLALPPRTAILRRDAFDEREDDFYQALYTQSQSQFNTYVTAGTLVNNYAHIFDLLTRLRQAVDHPYLVVYTATGSKDQLQYEGSGGAETCGLCANIATDLVVTACGHSYCKSCLSECLSGVEGSDKRCPECDKPLTVDFTDRLSTPSTRVTVKKNGYKRSSILNRVNLDEFKTSTKIEAVKEELNHMLEEDAAAKAIIFSQFTSMLDLIGFSLGKAGIKFVKLDGSMSMSARDQMIETFTKDADTKVFLMSLKAGGVALNLTVASHVFLMDPWWNPAVEQQAQDRIHRLGQFKPIRVIRFIIENTIEERILKLQEKKQLVFEGTVGGSSEALGKLTEEDLRFLFTN